MLRKLDRINKEEIKRLGERSEDMKQVTNHFMELSASEKDRLWEEHREKSRLVLHGQRKYARDEARRKIVQEGMEQGMKRVALQMLKEKIDMDLISRVTGITKEKILKLKSRA